MRKLWLSSFDLSSVQDVQGVMPGSLNTFVSNLLFSGSAWCNVWRTRIWLWRLINGKHGWRHSVWFGRSAGTDGEHDIPVRSSWYLFFQQDSGISRRSILETHPLQPVYSFSCFNHYAWVCEGLNGASCSTINDQSCSSRKSSLSPRVKSNLK